MFYDGVKELAKLERKRFEEGPFAAVYEAARIVETSPTGEFAKDKKRIMFRVKEVSDVDNPKSFSSPMQGAHQ